MKLVEFAQDDVIRWLHSVEYGKPVRMAGLITELYFSKKLQSAQSSGKFSCVAEGWFYTTPLPTDTSVRYWYRLAELDSELSEVEQAFFERLHPIGHRIFFLRWDIHLEKIGEQVRPEISMAVNEWVAKDDHQNTTACSSLQEQFNAELNAYLSGVSFDLSHGWNANTPFSKWLKEVENRSLVSMFIQRCLMNSSVALKPLDLDAMALVGDSGKLVFLEFKRKYPTKGGSRPITQQDRPADYLTFAQEMLRAISVSREEDLKSSFNIECRKRNFEYINTPSFGLDMHHFETTMLCKKTGIEYRYVIWNAGRTEVKQPRSLPNTLSELQKILTENVRPVENPKWWVKTLSPSDVTGLTFTFGDDSGSYSKGIRLQVIFDAKS